jgi:hypothetical protein
VNPHLALTPRTPRDQIGRVSASLKHPMTLRFDSRLACRRGATEKRVIAQSRWAS